MLIEKMGPISRTGVENQLKLWHLHKSADKNFERGFLEKSANPHF